MKHEVKEYYISFYPELAVKNIFSTESSFHFEHIPSWLCRKFFPWKNSFYSVFVTFFKGIKQDYPKCKEEKRTKPK